MSKNSNKTLPQKELSKKLNYEIWLSVSEAASLAGVGDKTIRRAVKESNLLVYKIVKDRY